MATFSISLREEWDKYGSINALKEYFLAKSGGVQFFKEESFWTYVKQVRYFVQFLGFEDPDEALKALKEMSKKDRTDTLIKFIAEMRNRGNAPSSQKTVYNLVKKWLVVNETELNWVKVITPKVRPVVNDRAPTKEELRTILSYLRPWMVSTSLILESSGMRVGTLSQLKMKHVNFETDPEIAILEVPPEANKAGIGYFTAISPEARRALERHIEQRTQPKVKYGEGGRVDVPGEIIGPESPLIAAKKREGHAPPSSMRDSWNTALRNAGLDMKSGGYFVLHIHTLRKFFRSQVDGILTKSIREAFMGHITTEYLDSSYLRIPTDKLLLEYRKAVPALTVFEDTQTDEFQKKQLLRQASILLPEDKLAMLREILARTKNIDQAVEKFKELTEQKANGNGNGSIKVVDGEEKMLEHLNEGWELLRELNGGDRYLLKAPPF